MESMSSWSALFLLYTSRKCGSPNTARKSARKLQGYAAAQRGELLDSDSVRQWMDERKTSWLSEHRKA
jgi:hypothetical protein